MDRREALQLLATGAILQLAPAKMAGLLREARAALGTETSFRTLNPHEAATVSLISDLIIPRTETPGASDVGVPQFVDLILTEWYTEDERTHFLHGLAGVDSRTQTLYGKHFTDCSASQHAEILQALGEEMLVEAEAGRYSGHRYRGSLSKPDQNFYYMLRGLVLTGYT